MMYLEDWCTAMESSAKGEASLSNIIYDCSLNRLPKTLTRLFLRKVISHWRRKKPLTRAETIITTVVSSQPKLYLCKGNDVPGSSRNCSRIMDIEDLFAKNIDLMEMPSAVGLPVTDSQVRFLESGGLARVAKGKMRTRRRPVAWVTKTDSYSMVRASTARRELASKTRVILGLDRFQEDQRLVEIQYPALVQYLRQPHK